MTDEAAASPAPTPKQKVWDAPVRLVHWLFVFLVAFSWWTAEEGEMQWHFWSGLTIVGLLVFRIYWGFAGPETARFARFIKGPGHIIGYAGKLFRKDYRASFGHNPLGALSVVAILLALAAQVALGLFATDTDGLESGPLSRYVSYELSRAAADLHEDAFDILLWLIVLHVAAIVFYLIVKRTNLIGPMITGNRRSGDGEGPASGIAPVPLWRFVLGVAISVAAVWLIAR
ncbi:MAG: cytochrome b/b6 domain-containing protein [Hyphomonadaceae bacterium]